jgi:hypothetical protein
VELEKGMKRERAWRIARLRGDEGDSEGFYGKKGVIQQEG